MRLLLLSWEYPPLVYGGLARHVHALSTTLAGLGHDVVVVTQHGGSSTAPDDEVVDGVRVLRVRQDPPHLPVDDILAWTMGLDHALTRTALAALDGWRPDVVHAHDWLVAHAAANLQAVWGCPLVATIHATEAGRWQGWLSEPLNRAIHTVEWWLTWSADRVIVCSEAMRGEVATLFGVPVAKTEVIGNGVDVGRWSVPVSAADEAGRRWRGDSQDRAPLLVYSGRLEYEKGVHTLLAAMPTVRRRHPGARLVVAGRGGQEQTLREQARALRLGRCVRFAGWLDDADLQGLVAAADLALVPSAYEPFGLVALEAAAAGTAVVAADTGGLAEVVRHERTGWRVPPGDTRAWADAIDLLTRDAELRATLAKQGQAVVEEDYTWAAVARRTVAAYDRASTAPVHQPRPDFVVAEGNQLR